MDGRFSVAIDDVRRIAIPVLRHRLSTNFQAQADGAATGEGAYALVHRSAAAADSATTAGAATGIFSLPSVPSDGDSLAWSFRVAPRDMRFNVAARDMRFRKAP